MMIIGLLLLASLAHAADPPAQSDDRPRTTRPATPPPPGTNRPATDRRYQRPPPTHTVRSPAAPRPPPTTYTYRPYYGSYYAHPYYRYRYPTPGMVVTFGYRPDPWRVAWAPAARPGWVWTSGYYGPYGYWYPGYWRPAAPPPRANLVFVPGTWYGTTYVEGYWRVSSRPGWVWVTTSYRADGSVVPGHWRPIQDVPRSYVWEPGFFDGQRYVDGFWRPDGRAGYRWVGSAYDETGVYRAGYWYPIDSRPDQVWVPGWFDGTAWVDGYWVPRAEYLRNEETWTPSPLPEGGPDTSTGEVLAVPAR